VQGEVPQRAAPRSRVALLGQERQEEVKGIEIVEQRQRHVVEAHMEYCTGCCSESSVVTMGM